MRALLFTCAAGLALGLAGCSKDETDQAVDVAKEVEAKVETTTQKAAEAVATPAADRAADAKKPTMGTLTASDRKRLEATVASSFGKGSFKTEDGSSYSFTLEGSMLEDKSSHGKFRFYSFQSDGKMDIKGEMECVEINSGDRKIWMSGRITENTSTDEKYQTGQYATGNYIQFRARPNSMDGQSGAEMQIPEFVSEDAAKSFCKTKSWPEGGLYALGENDLIAAIP